MLKVIVFFLSVTIFTLVCGEENCALLDWECYSCERGNIKDENGCDLCACRPKITDNEKGVWHGNLRLTENQARMFDENRKAVARGLVVETPEVLRWNEDLGSDGIYKIPYIYSDDTLNNTEHAETILKAISSLFSQTCVKFVPAKVGDRSIVRFDESRKARTCTYFLGRRENRIRTVKGCNTVGDVLMAIMSVLGFRSESLRSDRDEYIWINYRNMFGGPKVEAATAKLSLDVWDNTSRSSYDKASITHFDAHKFSAFGAPTVFDKSTGEPIECNKWALSTGDKQQIRRMFNCTVKGIRQSRTCYNLLDEGVSYRGRMNVTESGLPCQQWSAQVPHKHDMKPNILTGSDLEENFCRNPDVKDRPWCFTTNENVTWEYCNVSVCNKSQRRLSQPTGLNMKPYGWAPWLSWERCTRTCGPGRQYRKRICIGAEKESEHCLGKYWEVADCEYVATCNVTDHWTNWQPWSESDVECGNGTRTRIKSCVGDVGLGSCVGDSVDTEDYVTGINCPLYSGGECFNASDPTSYNGTVNEDRFGNPCLNWALTDTNTSAYPDTVFVLNYCRNPKGKKKGPYCHFKTSSTNRCNVTFCKLSAQWGEWGRWSACSESCAVEGTKMRTRRCIRGTTGEGSCSAGDAVDVASCNLTCVDLSVRDPVVKPKMPPVVPTTPARLPDCVHADDPRSYRGTASRTMSGAKCQHWNSGTPTRHNYTDSAVIAEQGLSENYCRTPDEDDDFPWCYTAEYISKKEKCKIPMCQSDDTSQVYLNVKGRPYYCELYTETDDWSGEDENGFDY